MDIISLIFILIILAVLAELTADNRTNIIETRRPKREKKAIVSEKNEDVIVNV